MITYSKNLYVADSISDVDKVKRKIRMGRGQIKIYLISLSNSSDQLDIFHNSMLKQRAYRKLNLRIVGLANSNYEAMEIVQKMVEDSIKKTNSPNVKDYLINIF